MDSRYRAIYRQLYETFTEPGRTIREDPNLFRYAPAQRGRDPWDERGRAAVRRPIETAAGQIAPRVLREDAEALLFLNFYNLVLVPLRDGGQVDEDIVENDIRQDIPMLVRAASALSEENEISGHDVLDALSQNWDNLRTGRHRLWMQT